MAKVVGVALRALVGRGALAGLVLCAALMCLPSGAKAVNVTVLGVTYDVQFFALGRSFDDDEAALMATPWWGNPTLADDIADAYLAQVGVGGSPFTDNALEGTSLYFAFAEGQIIDPNDAVDRAALNEGAPAFSIPPGVTPFGLALQSSADANAAYAFGTIVPAAVPEIDGGALFKALFLLFTLHVWLQVRRNRRARG